MEISDGRSYSSISVIIARIARRPRHYLIDELFKRDVPILDSDLAKANVDD